MRYWNSALLLGLLIAFQVQAQQEQEHWLDQMQLEVSESLDATARWFDGFFAEEGILTKRKAGSEARIMFGWEPRSRDFAEFDSRFRVKVDLPHLEQQLDLILSDYDEQDDNTSVKAARNDAIDNRNRFSLALRWTPKEETDFRVSHRLGVGRKLQPYAKSTLQKTYAISADDKIKLEGSVYYYTQDRFGSHLMAEYERQTGDNALLRFANHYYFRDETDDWLWQHSLRHFIQTDESTALICSLYAEGVNQPNYRATEYLTSVRWRHNAVRKWLFFEVEPFVLWSREEDFKPSYGLALRVEGFFGEP
ncbi:hypothetical protein HMF8227_02804 [Saliniradius amylolyticus]|uniref:Alginate export domain-containing protein n=1 Tax=Saliniradius amylolyticus TaxID=2183582 RepID=A0A2S2E6I7_9ALTE|nr:hypothetical protein [Saliniradius amylolyticus]AWL13253.1 hypothetical protein HMF8227_02804 [Saliniradius amylolyticus]